MVGQDEDRPVIGRLVAPPALPLQVPVVAARAEHVAAHDEGSGRRDALDLRGVRLGLLEHPPMQTVPDPLPEGIGQALVRARDDTVDRHRHISQVTLRILLSPPA
jgi:hypothetical protein